MKKLTWATALTASMTVLAAGALAQGLPPAGGAPAQPAQQAQQPGQQPGQQPAQPAGPSAEEVAAIQAMQQMTNPAQADARMQAVDLFVIRYPQSQFLGYVFSMGGEAAQNKQDSGRAVFYYEKAVAADPNDYNSMLMIAAEVANNTGRDDLRKDEKLGRATELANKGMELAKVAPKPNPEVTDEQWENVRRNDLARGQMALGMIGLAKLDYDGAAAAFKASLDIAANQEPGTMIRLGNALNEAGRPDEAIPVLDQVIGMAGLPEVYINIAKNEKTRSEQIKARQAAQ